MDVVVATHGHCFDGLASAALFTRLLGNVETSDANVRYRACGYGANQPKADAKTLIGDQNVILDYRFFPAKKLTWYFDHHRTAFANDGDRATFERLRPEGRYFFDDRYGSCTRLIADVGRDRFDLDTTDLTELIECAHKIDSASFDDAEEAVDRKNPILRFVAVVEQHGDDRFLERYVPALLTRPLVEIATSEEIQSLYGPIGEKHARFVERVRERGRPMGRVVFVDLTDEVVQTVGKFVTYALYPESVYSVVVGRMKSGIKISIGYNPWCGVELDADVSAICARHGGGGHPAVGGIAFRKSEHAHAVELARSIARELDAGAQTSS